MSRKFPSIPTIGQSLASLQAAVGAIRGQLTFITGQEQPRIQPLPAGATQEQIAAKVNEVIARLQGTES